MDHQDPGQEEPQQEQQEQQQQQQQHHQQPARQQEAPLPLRLPLPPVHQDTELIFWLSDEERQWALQLKAAVDKSPDLEDLADLQYAQFAIANFAERGDPDKTLDRIRGLQAFRKEYNINDTFEDGMAIITAFTKAHSLSLLSVAYDDETQNYGLIYDRTRLLLQNVSSHEDYRTFLGTPYYMFNCFCPDPQSMRQGIFLIGECEGMQSSSIRMSVIQQMWYHFLAHYPCVFRSIKFFHTNVVANLGYSMMKHFLPVGLKSRVVLGCQFGANISSLYLLPTEEIAVERTLKRIGDFLRKRYENQAVFKL